MQGRLRPVRASCFGTERRPDMIQRRVSAGSITSSISSTEAIADPVERENYYKAKVAELYANGKAVSIASVLEIDEVIDPAETRRWIMSGLRSVPKQEARTGRKRPCIDAW